jgi:hypothetical protein
MPYAHLILHTDEYDLDTDIYEHSHMSAYVPIDPLSRTRGHKVDACLLGAQ